METPSKFLPVLADWFGVNFDLLGSEEVARKVLQYSIPLYRYRGTKIGLKALLYLVSGIVPEIVEGELPFDALCISDGTDISSTILDSTDNSNTFSVYFPVHADEMEEDMIKRLYFMLQNEKPVNTECYLYFKKPQKKTRTTTVFTKDIMEMGVDGIEF
jgi:P2-related tail formation protein